PSFSPVVVSKALRAYETKSPFLISSPSPSLTTVRCRSLTSCLRVKVAVDGLPKVPSIFTESDSAPGFTACSQTSPPLASAEALEVGSGDEPAPQPVSSSADTARVERRARGRTRKMGPHDR